MTTALLRALVRHGWGSAERGWLSFEHPLEQAQIYRVDEVLTAVDRAEAAARAGHWVVLMVAYDAAAAFDTALVARRDPAVPLLAYAVFDAPVPSAGPRAGRYDVGPWDLSRTRAAYVDAIEAIRARIAAGDVYQVNYTLRVSAAFLGDAEALFAELCRAQPADHLAYLDLGSAVVCSASPELFLRRHGRTVETRPMKGTRPRSDDPERDGQLAAALRASEKDRAENTMIVDMARNDLGRVATTGTVVASALHAVETYPTVHQMTSTVVAETDASLSALLAATFPAASITGAPKVAACRIIAELEPEPRGVYTGAVGVLAPGGDLELNVAIRTAWVDRDRGRVTYGIGGGIVWDSEPAAEWREAHDKARILRRAARPFRLLETLAWWPGTGPVLLDRHLARLAAAARHFRFAVDIESARRRLMAIRSATPQRVRLLVDPQGQLELQLDELVRPAAPEPWRLLLDTEPVDSDDEFLRHKTTRRERYDEARARFPSAPDVLLWNERGEVTESTRANVVVRLDDALVTPPASAGLLPGVLRAELLAQGLIRARTVMVDELAGAEAWIINSVRGWVPIVIDGGGGPVGTSATGVASDG